MTTGEGEREGGLLYDFYRAELWKRRIDSMDDAIDSAFKLFDSVISTIDGLSAETMEQLIQAAGAGDYAHLEEKMSRLAGSLSTRASQERIDPDFEAKQLLNLYTLCFTIYNFFWTALKAEMWRAVAESAEAGTPPPIHQLRAAFQQVANDVEIVQRALVQRRRERDSAGNQNVSLTGRALFIADKLAFMALAPAQPLLPARVNPIAFLSRETHLHHVPYHDNFVLIGIKYDHLPPAINQRAYGDQRLDELPPLPTFELMAIAHEVGHYVYHQAWIEGERIATWSAQQFDHPWREEIFADCYGCLIGGPLLALSLQALLAYSDDNAACANDGDHPTALLRPFILSEILRTLAALQPDRYPFAGVARQLNENWALTLQRHGHRVAGAASDGQCIVQAHSGEEYEVGPALAPLRPMIHAYAERLLAHLSPDAWDEAAAPKRPPRLPWTDAHPADLHDYDRVMAAMTGFELAFAPIPNHALVGYGGVNQAGLQQYIDQWRDSGPLTIGGHKRPLSDGEGRAL